MHVLPEQTASHGRCMYWVCADLHAVCASALHTQHTSSVIVALGWSMFGVVLMACVAVCCCAVSCSDSNEADSAKLAHEMLTAAGLPAATVEKVSPTTASSSMRWQQHSISAFGLWMARRSYFHLAHVWNMCAAMGAAQAHAHPSVGCTRLGKFSGRVRGKLVLKSQQIIVRCHPTE
jgi:hypothetical protein